MSARAAISRLAADEWMRLASDCDQLPPGAGAETLSAVAAGLDGASAAAVLIEGAGGSQALPLVIQEETGMAMPFGLPAGPVILEGEPGPIRPARVRRALGLKRLLATIHHTRAAQHDARGASWHSTHLLSLGGEDPLARYRQRVRRKLKAAAGAGIKPRVGSAGDRDRLVEILAAGARADDRPLYPSAEVIGAVAATSEALTLFASHEGEDVSAALFLVSPREFLYWKGATLPAHGELSPSYVVIDAAVREAVARGCRYLNLGSSDGLPGVAHFKEGFGAERVPYPSFDSRTLDVRLRGHLPRL